MCASIQEYILVRLVDSFAMIGHGSTLFVPILDEDAAINTSQSMFADEGKPKSERLRSLDAFRGLVITGASALRVQMHAPFCFFIFVCLRVATLSIMRV